MTVQGGSSEIDITIEIQVSCEGGFAACEGEEWQGHWNRYVDAHLQRQNRILGTIHVVKVNSYHAEDTQNNSCSFR